MAKTGYLRKVENFARLTLAFTRQSLEQLALRPFLQFNSLEPQQEKLGSESAAKPGQAAIGANHAMTGNYNG